MTLLVIAIAMMAVLWYTSRFEGRDRDLTWDQFQELITDEAVADVTVRQNKDVPTGRVEIELKQEDADGDLIKYYYVSDVNEIQDYLKEQAIDYEMLDVPQDNWLATTILPTLLVLAGVFLIFALMNRQGGANAGTKAMSFGKSRARMSTDSDRKITFAEVAGLQEEKEELEEIVDFLKAPKKYIQVGARIPKGVLLVGPPGNRKDPACKSGGRRGGSTVFHHFRFGFCGNVCGRGSFPCAGSV